MNADAEKLWDDLSGALRAACGYGIPTPREARSVVAAAAELPLSDQEIDAIVTSVVSGRRPTPRGDEGLIVRDRDHDDVRGDGPAPRADRRAGNGPASPPGPGWADDGGRSANGSPASPPPGPFAPDLPGDSAASGPDLLAGSIDGRSPISDGRAAGAGHLPSGGPEGGPDRDPDRRRPAGPSPDSRLQTSWLRRIRVEPGATLFGRFRVEKYLGGGGMGKVWLVRHLQLDAPRALKLIIPEIAIDKGVRKRFQREAQLMARLTHPNAATVHDAEVSSNRKYAYIAMEYVAGGTLLDRMEPYVAMPIDWVARILDQLCDVIHAAHELGIVHRDLKPSNLMLVGGRAEDCEVLKVIDFGIAKLLDTARRGGRDSVIRSISNPCTPAYASPEQLDPDGFEIDRRSDIYTMGVILYEMLMGRRPNRAAPSAFSQVNPAARIAPQVERVVMRCLAKDPGDRPQTALELAAAFRQALADAASPGPGPGPVDPIFDWDAFVVGGCSAAALAPWDEAPAAPASWQAPGDAAPGVDPTVTPRVPEPSGPFVAIPPGPCRLGSDAAGYERLQRQARAEGANVAWLAGPEPRRADLPGFEIGQAPVTVGEYLRFERATGYQTGWDDPPDAREEDRLPVVNITCEDAEAYCEWAGARLPSADEWEKAARGDQGRVYPWGDGFDPTRCACRESGARGRTPVDAHPTSASPYGVLDCVGNVGELVDAGKGTKKLVRGGAFNDHVAYHGALWAKAWYVEPHVREPNIGFRIARGGPAPRGPLPGPAPFVRVAGPVALGCDPAAVDRLKTRYPLGDSVVAGWLADPLRTASLAPFEIGVHAVTQQEYWEFVRATGHPQPSHWRATPLWSGRPFLEKYATHPVVQVTHADALAYCRWRSDREGRPYDLPSRERWQAAACGPRFRLYPWGDEFRADWCNGGEAHLGRTADVRDCPEGDSPCGCRQMTGNVFEWLAGADGKARSMRGGSFGSACQVYGLTIFEMAVPEAYVAADVGFRVVRT